MIDERAPPTGSMPQSEDGLTQLSPSEFVAAWETLVGEPPAMMLDSQSEMIRVLVESTPVTPQTGMDALHRYDGR